ncbi:hypothetical protein MTO96_043370 [Rhipicephalus appendiculatus]
MRAGNSCEASLNSNRWARIQRTSRKYGVGSGVPFRRSRATLESGLLPPLACPTCRKITQGSLLLRGESYCKGVIRNVDREIAEKELKTIMVHSSNPIAM